VISNVECCILYNRLKKFDVERVWKILNNTASTEKLLCFPQLNKW